MTRRPRVEATDQVPQAPDISTLAMGVQAVGTMEGDTTEVAMAAAEEAGEMVVEVVEAIVKDKMVRRFV